MARDGRPPLSARSNRRGGAPRCAAAFATLALGCAAPSPSTGHEVLVRWPDAQAQPRGAVRLAGQGPEAGLVVRVDEPGAPPLPGRVDREEGAASFVPRYSWTPGLAYVAEVDGEVVGRYRFPAPELRAEAVVSGVFPSESVLPQNVLRVYLAFSAPMSRGRAYEHVHVEDAEGRRVEDAFLPVEPELWDPEGRRLTLLFDPGRIKRGLAKSRDMGPPLEPDARYTLVVDAAFPDARGAPLVAGLRHPFETTAPDRTQPDMARWTLELPRAGARDALVVRFAERLDRALLDRMLAVRDAGGRLLPGDVEVLDGERTWSFRPHAPWVAGEHLLVADPLLEDPAGNSFARPFEVDPGVDPAGLRRTAERAFSVVE